MNQGYSQLFQSISGSGAGNQNFLSDYASIKSGGYGKLLRAYYGTGSSSSTVSASKKSSSSTNILDKILEEKKNPKISKQAQEANTNLTNGLSKLKNSVSALQNDKIYTSTENGQSASDKVVSAMKNYVEDYNNVVTAAKKSTLAGKTAYVANIMDSTKANADKLAELGITINVNGTLQLNEGKLKAADVSKVQDLFSTKDIMGYGSKLTSRLKFASANTANTTNKTESKDKTDTQDSTTNNATGSSAALLKADSIALSSDKLYEKITDKNGNEDYDIENIFAAAKSFVKNYNNMLDSAESSANSGVLSNLSQLKGKTARNADVLKQFGISVNTKGRMQIDEDTFKKADMSKVQKFFKDYGSSVATNASLVDFYMTTHANKANSYTSAGAYNLQEGFRYADYI